MSKRIAALTDDLRQATKAVTASRLASMAKSRAKSKWGSSMQFLGRELKSAVVAHEYVSIIAGQEPIEATGQAARLIEGAQEVLR